MKRNTNTTATTKNDPVKNAADSIKYKNEMANNADEDIRNIIAANLARTTRVEYAVLNLIDLTTTTGEMMVEYTRSSDKAEKLVADALRKSGADLNKSRVIVTGIFNVATERRVYNTTDILQHAVAVYNDEESARQFAQTAQTLEDVNWSIRKVESYAYSALVWTRDEITGTNAVESFVWDDTERYSGIRSYTNVINRILKVRYQCAIKEDPNANQKCVVYVDPESRARIESPKYAVITAGELAKCSYTIVGEKNAANTTADETVFES